jgi:hypothetical protein
MMSPLPIGIAAFIGVATLVGGIAQPDGPDQVDQFPQALLVQ